MYEIRIPAFGGSGSGSRAVCDEKKMKISTAEKIYILNLEN
jgi:hypothetical protein